MAGARTPRFCHLCGNRLSSRYYVYNATLVVCGSCDARRPRCARCGVPCVGNVATTTGAILCPNCQREAPRCAACGDHITSTWYSFDELLPAPAVRQFCPRCVQSRPRCDLCRAPVSTRAQPLPDGQFRCDLCLSEIVLDDTQVIAVYHDAFREVGAVLGGELREMPRLDIVSRRRMGEVRREFEREQTADGERASHVLGFFVRAHGKNTIYIELGLPRPILLGTLAHELAHAWQAEHGIRRGEPLLQEGFAEWVAHRTLVARGFSAVAARSTRREDLYGRGLRHFLALERSSGHAGVLAAAQTTSARRAPGQ